MSNKVTYKLGEELANGVKYFGQEKTVKKVRTAMFVCPRCNELWRVAIAKVKIGAIASCCGRGRGKKKTNNQQPTNLKGTK